MIAIATFALHTVCHISGALQSSFIATATRTFSCAADLWWKAARTSQAAHLTPQSSKERAGRPAVFDSSSATGPTPANPRSASRLCSPPPASDRSPNGEEALRSESQTPKRRPTSQPNAVTIRPPCCGPWSLFATTADNALSVTSVRMCCTRVVPPPELDVPRQESVNARMARLFDGATLLMIDVELTVHNIRRSQRWWSSLIYALAGGVV